MDDNKQSCCSSMGGEEKQAAFERFSVITCPECGHSEREEMPTDACQFFYFCKGCEARLRPHSGDCCVYCSYGTVPCPPIQLAGGKENRDKSGCC